MASRIISVGSLAGFLAGSLDLRTYLSFLGDSQFRVLCSLSSITLLVTVLVSAVFVTEEDPRLRSPASEKSVGVRLFSTLKVLSPQIKTLFTVQIFACFAFFPILFYGSVWVAEIYAAPYLKDDPGMGKDELDALFEEGTRRGAIALAWNAAVMLFSAVLVPVVVTPTYDAKSGSSTPSSGSSTEAVVLRLPIRFLHPAPWLACPRLHRLPLERNVDSQSRRVYRIERFGSTSTIAKDELPCRWTTPVVTLTPPPFPG